jgi:hypothetical protein
MNIKMGGNGINIGFDANVENVDEVQGEIKIEAKGLIQSQLPIAQKGHISGS